MWWFGSKKCTLFKKWNNFLAFLFHNYFAVNNKNNALLCNLLLHWKMKEIIIKSNWRICDFFTCLSDQHSNSVYCQIYSLSVFNLRGVCVYISLKNIQCTTFFLNYRFKFPFFFASKSVNGRFWRTINFHVILIIFMKSFSPNFPFQLFHKKPVWFFASSSTSVSVRSRCLARYIC
jgi:hypothetical protein